MSDTPITDKIIADADACPETRVVFLIKHLANQCKAFERAALSSIERTNEQGEGLIGCWNALVFALENELSETNRVLKYVQKVSDLLPRRTPPSAIEPSGWCIRHTDGRWRTMDSLGMPDWTDDPKEALCLRLRKHADAYAADDPDDVRIVPTESA